MKRRIKSRIASWRIGEYIRQLSVVTLGVVITFVGSDIITEYSTQKRLKTALQLVKSELELKRDDVMMMKKSYDKEVSAAKYIQKYKNRIREANEDTLGICISVPFKSAQYNSVEDAMEMLKTSGLFQQIKNQNLAIQLIKTNDIVKMQAYGTFNTYAQRKTDLMNKMNNHPTFSAEYEKVQDSSVYDKALFLLQYQEFKDLSALPLFFIDSDRFLRVVDTIDMMIKQMDDEYGLD